MRKHHSQANIFSRAGKFGLMNFLFSIAFFVFSITGVLFAEFDNTNILVEEAVNHIYQQRYKQAYATLQRAYERSPRHPGVHFNLGRVFELTGNFQEALKEYQLAAMLDPSMVAARRGIARCTVELKRSRGEQQAAVIEETARKRAQQNQNRQSYDSSRVSQAPIVKSSSQSSNETKTRVPQAQKTELPAMPTSPMLPPTAKLRVPPIPPQAVQKAKGSIKSEAETQAEHFIERGRYQQAIELLESLLVEDADNPRLHYLLGKALSLKGDLFPAIKHLEEAVRVDEHFHAAYYLLAQNYSKVNLLDDALKNYKAYFSVKPQAGVAVEIARIYERMGRPDLAKEYYAKANAMNPGNPALQSKLDQASIDVANDLYFRANQAFTTQDFAGALSLYEQALATGGLDSTYRKDAERKIEIARVRAAEVEAQARPAREGFATARQLYATVDITYPQFRDIKFKTAFTGDVILEWRGYVARKFSRYGLDFLLMIKELTQEELDQMRKDRNDYRLNPAFNNQPVFLVSAAKGAFPEFIKIGSMINIVGKVEWRTYQVTNDLGQTLELPAISYITAYP